MKTKQHKQSEPQDPNLKLFHSLNKSLSRVGKSADDMIAATLSIDTSEMPAEAKAVIDRLKAGLPGIVDKMKKSDNPVQVAEETARQWR